MYVIHFISFSKVQIPFQLFDEKKLSFLVSRLVDPIIPVIMLWSGQKIIDASKAGQFRFINLPRNNFLLQ